MFDKSQKVKVAVVSMKDIGYDSDNTNAIVQGITDWEEVTWEEAVELQRGLVNIGPYYCYYRVVYQPTEQQHDLIIKSIAEARKIVEKGKKEEEERRLAREAKKKAKQDRMVAKAKAEKEQRMSDEKQEYERLKKIYEQKEEKQ